MKVVFRETNFRPESLARIKQMQAIVKEYAAQDLRLTKTDIAWAAGVVDGEGCLYISRQRPNGRDRMNDSFRIGLKVTMGHLPTIEKLARTFAVGTVQNHVGRNERVNASYSWICMCAQVKPVLVAIRPFATTKQQEIELALTFLGLPSGTVGGRGGNPKQSRAQVDQKLRFYWQLRMLKPRWRFYEEALDAEDKSELVRLGVREAPNAQLKERLRDGTAVIEEER